MCYFEDQRCCLLETEKITSTFLSLPDSNGPLSKAIVPSLASCPKGGHGLKLSA